MFNVGDIDPIAFSLGPLKVHWYGLSYLLGFAGVWFLGRIRAQKSYAPITVEAVDDLVFYGAMGAMLGGRIGYQLFYNFDIFIADPLLIIKIWQGGMSLHGGVIGVFIAYWFMARKYDCKLLQLIDFLAPLSCVGLFSGRVANFINGELWGKTTDLPWGVIFPRADYLPRHPSQLYEALLEGLLMFVVLWLFTAKERPYMAPTGLILMGYGCSRFFVEFFRLPDAHLGYIAFGWLTMGQILTLPMILIGALLFYFAYKKKTCSNI